MDGLEGQQIDEENGSAAGSNDNFEGVQPHQQPANAAAPPPVVAPLPPPLQDHAIERPTAPRVAARSPTSSVRVVVNPNQNQQALLRQQAHSPTQGGGGTSANSSSSYRSIRGGGFAGARVDSTNSFQNYVVAGPERDNIDESMSFDSPASSGWTVVELSQDGGVPPSARSLHAAALLNGNLLVFGGYDGSQRVNTFHAFSFAEKRWSPVLPAANSPPPPSPRDRHVAVGFGNTFWIHGGFDGTSRVSDFWAFDFSTMTWREVLALQGRPPTPRHSHAAVVHGHSMYLFGGYDGSYKADLHEFDFTLSRWSVVPAVGRRPRARYRATCVVHKNSMILYGGHDGTRHLADTHIFDFDTKTWANLVCEGTQPIPRDSHVSVVHGNCMYCFGGSSGSAMNDLHELQLPSTPNTPARWRAVQTSRPDRADQPRHRFCHVAVVYQDSMFVFGGYDGADRLNDFLRFDFAVYDLSFEVPPSSIISDLRALVNDSSYSDITFIVEGHPVYAHKLMLMRCSYFQALFSGNMRESMMDTITFEQVRYPIFLRVLEYLYTDQVLIPLNDAMELFEAADLFCINRLKTMCEKRMLQSITVDTAASIFHAADMHSAGALREKAKKYILSHFEEVSRSIAFEEMGRQNFDLVMELLHSR